MFPPARSIKPPFTYVYGMYISIAGVVAAVENTVVLRVLARKDQRRIKSNKLLMSLVVSDMLFGCMGIPDAYILFDSGPIPSENEIIFFSVVHVILVYLLFVTLLSMVIISYDRYLLIAKYKDYNKLMTEKKVRCMIVGSWMAALVMLGVELCIGVCS